MTLKQKRAYRKMDKEHRKYIYNVWKIEKEQVKYRKAIVSFLLGEDMGYPSSPLSEEPLGSF